MHPLVRPRTFAAVAVVCLVAAAVVGVLTTGGGPDDPPPASTPAPAPDAGPRPALGGLFVPGYWAAPAAGAGVTLWLRNPGGRADTARLWYAGAQGAPRLLGTLQLPAGGSAVWQPGGDVEPGGLYVQPADAGTRLEGVATIVRVAQGGAKRIERVPAQPVVADGARRRLVVPVLHNANGTTASTLSVMNTSRGGRALAVRITYRAPDGTELHTDAVKLPWLGNAAAGFAEPRPELRGEKVVSAEITADGAIAALAEADDGAILLAHEGLRPAGGTRPAPLVMANNGGTSSAIQVHNSGEQAARVLVTYDRNQAAAGPGGPPCPAPRPATRVVPPGGLAFIVQSGDAGDPGYDGSFRGCVYVGSARVQAGQAIAAVVTQLGPRAGSAYATPHRFGEHEVSLPLVEANAGTVAGIEAQFESGQPGRVALAGGPNSASERPCAVDRVELDLAGPLILPGGPPFAGCDYTGPLRIRDPGTRLSVVCNQLLRPEQGFSDGLATMAAAQ